MKEIIIKISPDGSQFKTEVQGIKGPSCEDLTKSLTNALGSVESSGKTPEFYEEDLNVINSNI